MNDQKDLEARWRELDALLGLAPEPVKPVAPPPVVAAEAPPPPIVQAPPPPAFEAPSPAPSPPIVEPVQVVAPEPPMAVVENIVHIEEMIVETLDGDADESMEPDDSADAEGEEAAGDEATDQPAGEGDGQRKRRRRRRRGRRRGGDKPEGDGQATAPSTNGTVAENSEPPQPRTESAVPVGDTERGEETGKDGERGRDGRPRRRRGRRRRDGEPAAGAPTTASAPVAVPRADVSDEMDDDSEELETPARVNAPLGFVDDTDFTNWNVPSWQEIVGSLHRPDR